jgi:aldehyde dehydrogenase (NAD+)
MFRYYADLAQCIPAEEQRGALPHGRTVVRREPIGVVAAITPWNYPQPLAAMKIAPALAAGCTVVLKPALETALDAFVLADASVEAGLPDGVLNVVPGGREEGAHLVASPGVRWRSRVLPARDARSARCAADCSGRSPSNWAESPRR